MGDATHQNLCCFLHFSTVSPCMHTVGTHAPAAYSDITANTTAIPYTVSAYALMHVARSY